MLFNGIQDARINEMQKLAEGQEDDIVSRVVSLALADLSIRARA